MTRIILFLGLAFAGSSSAVEIATGKMLGKNYDARAFYVRSNNAQWKKTYTGPQFRKDAAGRLMNLRIAQGLYDDEWLTEVPFDPEKNTDRLVSALDTYKQNGVLAISVSLQAGNAGYNKEVAAIHRESEAKFGPGRGTLTSAFRPDGTLKEAWLKRLLRLVKELDRRGMILDLMYFYQAQDEVLENPEAIDRGVRNATDWLIDHDCRNVIIEIANEFNVPRYDHGQYIFHQMGRLIETARERFAAKKANFRLPISASASRLQLFDAVRDHADLTIIHGNHRSVDDKRKMIAAMFADPTVPGPILMNEDDNGRETTTATLKKELDSCDILFAGGSGWGFMPWRMVQMFPFRFYQPAATSALRDDMPVDERDPVYFRAVLEHIRRLVVAAP